MPNEPTIQVAMVQTDGLQTGMVADTPGGHPNIALTVVTPIAALLIRTANAFLTIFVGLVSAGMTTHVIPYDTFEGLCVTSAKLAISGTVLGFVKDLITLGAKLEQKYPLLTGNV